MKLNCPKQTAIILWWVLRAIAYSGLGWLLLAVLTFIFYPFEYDKDSDYVRFNKSFLGAVNRWQQVEYLDNKQFNADLSEFTNLYKPDINKQLYYYDYTVKIENNLALIYSMPKQDYENQKIFNIVIGKNKNKPLYSYVGAAYTKPINKQSSEKIDADRIVCKNNSIGYILPKKPILQEDTLSCHSDTQKIKYQTP